MDDKTTGGLDRCSPSQLRALLGLAVGEGKVKGSLPARAARYEEMKTRLSDLSEGEPDPAALLLSMVCSSESSLESLSAIKARSKRLLGKAQNEEDRAAATLLYHAAIAAAFALHGVNLSSRAISRRLPLYEDLAVALRNEPLGVVFRRATDRGAAEGLIR